MLTVLCTVPAAGWGHLGQTAALAAAGLRQPEGVIRLFTARAEELSNAPPPLDAAPSDGAMVFAPIQTAPLSPVPNGTAPEKGGTVLVKQYVGDATAGVAFQNKSGTAVAMAEVLKQGTGIVLADTDAPQVLITHTHTTECYLTHDDGVYYVDDETRSHDNRKTVVAVGEAVAEQLRQAGIGVIHDTVIHDEPYSNAYSASKTEVERLLKQYPTIRVVLDIHRDAIYPDDTTRIKPTAVINGKKAAQVMVMVGMKNTKAVPNPYVKQNLALGAQLQRELHTAYEGLARPMVLADGRYNQQLRAGSLLIEVGSDVNTAEEAVYAGELLGKGLAKILGR